MLSRCGLFISLLLLAAIPVFSANDSGALVRVAQGELKGTSGRIRSFKGIPYAAPPVGALRWQPPQPASNWEGTRDATSPGSACLQPQSFANIPSSAMSEDCLYLNVWTPAQDAKGGLPVMVYIHGGGMVIGSGSLPEDDGTALAAKGVVVVTLNYRLGVFGLLAHPDLTRESEHHSSGNYSLLDQQAALRWVRENIAAFGGDPKRVTVFGQSAGGTSVGYLLASPLSKGLFSRAILESPSRLFLPDPELDHEYRGLTSMETVGNAFVGHIQDARSWDAAQVMHRAQDTMDSLFAAAGRSRAVLKPEGRVHMPNNHDNAWWPGVDGWVIPAQLSELYRTGRVMEVPTIAGANANEGTNFLGDFPPRNEGEYRAYLHDTFAPCGNELYKLYPAGNCERIRAEADRLITDLLFLYGAEEVVSGIAKKQPNVYLYRFTRVTFQNWENGHGASHGAELGYVFGHIGGPAFDRADYAVSDEMMSAWVAFAKSGDPNGNASWHWPAWRQSGDEYLNFGNRSLPERLDRFRQFAVFRALFSPETPPQSCEGTSGQSALQ